MTSIRKTLGEWTRAEVWSATSGVCHYCGKQTNPFIDFTIDHIVPVSLGGTNELENLVAACATCNLTKRADSEFRNVDDSRKPSRIAFEIDPAAIDESFMRVYEARRLSGLTAHAFDRLINLGEIPIYKAGRRINSTRYVKRDDILQFLNKPGD